MLINKAVKDSQNQKEAQKEETPTIKNPFPPKPPEEKPVEKPTEPAINLAGH